MTHDEMEQAFVQLADLQRDNQRLLGDTLNAVKELSVLVVRFAEQQNDSLLRLEGLIENFIRGSRNGGNG